MKSIDVYAADPPKTPLNPDNPEQLIAF